MVEQSLERALNGALLETLGAHVHLTLVTIDNNRNALNVRTKNTVGYTV